MVSPIFGGTIFLTKTFNGQKILSRRNRRGKILDKDKFSRSSKSDLQVKNSYAIYVTRQENVFDASTYSFTQQHIVFGSSYP